MISRVAKRIGTNVLLLSLVSFLNDASTEIIMPILPLFIISLGGDEIIIGLISGSMESISSLLKAVFGFISDTIGKRKKIVFFGYLLSGIFKFLLSLSTVWQQILVFTSLERFGKGIRTAPRDAMISESIPKEKGRGFGIHRAFDTLGAIVGSVLALILIYNLHVSIRNVIIIASLVSILSLVPFIWIKETGIKRERIKFYSNIKGLPRSLKAFFLVTVVFSLSNISYMFFLRRSQEILKTDMFLLMYVIFNIFYAAFSYPSGVLSDRVGRWKVLSLGYLLFSLTSLGFMFAEREIYLYILFPIYGISYALFDGNQRAFVSDLSDKKIRATALGIFHTLVGITALPSGLIAGILWKEFGYSATFMYSSSLSIISAVALFTIGKLYKNLK